MTNVLSTILLGTAAVGSGLVAGIFFAFSAFVMAALARLPTDQGVAAMQSVNKVILRSWFIPVFFGTAVLGIVPCSIVPFQDTDRGMLAGAVGGCVYLVGVILVTVVFNVPLNNALDTVPPDQTELLWERYLRVWTAWNHVRTAASVVSMVLFVVGVHAAAS